VQDLNAERQELKVGPARGICSGLCPSRKGAVGALGLRAGAVAAQSAVADQRQRVRCRRDVCRIVHEARSAEIVRPITPKAHAALVRRTRWTVAWIGGDRAADGAPQPRDGSVLHASRIVRIRQWSN
jgi:hypothetical protein